MLIGYQLSLQAHGRRSMDLKLLLIFCFCASVIGVNDLDWYKNAVIYQIYVRSFQDSNGDGIGDLKGIIQRASYFESLGIDAIWLSPIYPSPNADFGYDISDMENVHPDYGTLDDFDVLVSEMEKKGIKVIMDFVPNHTSVKHSWFLASEARNDTIEKYSDFYVWQDPSGYDSENHPLPPNNWLCVMGTGSAWKWSDIRKQFFLHTFLEEQADINYSNPIILEKMKDVLKFWMRRGVKGFRMDAVSWLYDNIECGNEPPSPHPDPFDANNYANLIHNCTMDQPQNFDYTKQFRHTIDHFEDYLDQKQGRILIAETYSDFNIVMGYYGDKDSPGVTFPFNFYLIMGMWQGTNASVWADRINLWLDLLKDDRWPNWVLGNHDQIRVATKYANEWVDLLHMMVMSLTGTVITYNGEEIGLEDSIIRYDQGKDLQGLRAGPGGFGYRSRDFERNPMPWNSSHNGGFTTGNPWLPLAPSYWHINVESESSDNNTYSHLNIYKNLVKLRKEKTFREGDCSVQTTDDGLIIITRNLKDNPTYITVLNIGAFEVTANMNLFRNSLPSSLKVAVGSFNFPDKSSKVNTTEVYLPPKTGVILKTYSE